MTGFVPVIAARAAIAQDILADSSATVSNNESCFSLVAEIGASPRVRYGDISAVEVTRRGARVKGEIRTDVELAVWLLLTVDKLFSIWVIPFIEGFEQTVKVEEVLCERGESRVEWLCIDGVREETPVCWDASEDKPSY